VACMAPEMAPGARRGHGPAADRWSFGVMLFEMLTGRPPFPAGARAGGPDLAPGGPWGAMPEAAALIARLLEPDPDARAGWGEVRAHPWFRGTDFGAVGRQEAAPPVVPEAVSAGWDPRASRPVGEVLRELAASACPRVGRGGPVPAALDELLFGDF